MGETIINGIIEVSQEVAGQLQYDIGAKGDIYHAGQLNVIENTSTLKKSVSGSTIIIDDVSPVTHDMSVKISPVPQKNLLNRLIAKAYSSDMSVPTEYFINTYCSKKISFKQGITYTFSIKSVSGFSDSVTVWSPKFYIFDNGSLFVANATSPPVVFNTVFFTSDSSANEYICNDGSALWSRSTMVVNQGPWSMTITPVKDFEAAFIVTDGYVTDSVVVTEAQIEVGSTATSYAPYIENPITDLTAVNVVRFGKNLFNQYADTQVVTSYRGIVITELFKNIRENGVLSVSLKEGSTFQQGIYFGLISSLESGSGASAIWFQLLDSTDFILTKSKLSEMEYNTSRNYLIGVYPNTISSWNRIIDNYNIQIEFGTTATDYEPYNSATFTPTADGTVNGVTSLYPNTTLTTDTEGVIIDCEYYKDIDADDLIERTVTTYTNPKVKIIGSYAFYKYSALTTVNFPVATSVGGNAFFDCTSLTTINFPVATNIENSAFYGCSALTTINFPVATNIENSAFYGCSALTTVNFPVATNIKDSAFRNCKSLISSDFPVATNIGNSAFYDCKSLISSDFPVARSIGNSAFRNCKSLISSDFPIARSIGNSAFYGCSALTALILRNSTICTLSNKNAFTGCTKITGTGGYIYVPSSLVDAYKTATNWVTYASKFRALEDYTVDGTTNGALDESKVSA